MVSIVAAGVIVLLPAADKPLDESGLCWILSGRRQTGRVGSTGQPGGFFWGGSGSFSSFFVSVKRRQKQQTETDINTSASSYVHTARRTLLSAAAVGAESSQTLSSDGPSGGKNQRLWRRRSTCWTSPGLLRLLLGCLRRRQTLCWQFCSPVIESFQTWWRQRREEFRKAS